MTVPDQLKQSVFRIKNEKEFNEACLAVFRHQFEKTSVYGEFVRLLKVDPGKIRHYKEIPFLPVSFFRDHIILDGEKDHSEKIFSSSGTTGSIPSQHYVRDLKLYEESFIRSFRLFYGDPGSYLFLALLPGYLERQGSSLVYMMDFLVRESKQNGSGFYLHDLKALKEKLKANSSAFDRIILFGASYALLDFAEQFPMDLSGVTIMETGGMKGRRKEMIREELHEVLCRSFNTNKIHSEYGMTELLSQAYSKGDGIFRTPPWMKVLVRDTNDPFDYLPQGRTGGVNIIDLANIHSCSFISTQDLGKVYVDGSFEILGRFDESDVRGCNLLVV
jgi:phenylacetate-coenzyme A ligase PaaK-like adenylate-forming protein